MTGISLFLTVRLTTGSVQSRRWVWLFDVCVVCSRTTLKCTSFVEKWFPIGGGGGLMSKEDSTPHLVHIRIFTEANE